MEISKEKLDKINSINSDYSKLILKQYDFLNTNYEIENKVNIIDNFEPTLNNLDNFYMLFTSKDFKETNNIKIANINKINTENIKNVYPSKINIILDLNDVSTNPIYYTVMRRKIIANIEAINREDISNINNKKIKEILENEKPINVNQERKYLIDDVLSFFKLLYSVDINVENVFYYKENSLTNEDNFFINEFEKFIKALNLKENKYEYIYDTICSDIDKYIIFHNFCDFKENKCFSQRHKSLLNTYPKPKTDGCCFKVFRKCSHNNKDGTCKVKCISCKLFTCPILSKYGIGLRTSEFLLIRAFFNNKQKRDLVYNFYKPEDNIINLIKKH